MPKKIYLIIIICASLATHFLFFGQPRETVFDGCILANLYLATSLTSIFDIHPPLGKLLISGMGYATGFKPDLALPKCGQQFPDRGYLWLRLLPLLPAFCSQLLFFLNPGARSISPCGICRWTDDCFRKRASCPVAIYFTRSISFYFSASRLSCFISNTKIPLQLHTCFYLAFSPPSPYRSNGPA